MATYKHPGDEIDYTPGAAVAAGDAVVVGSIVGVATEAIAANALGSLAIRGVFAFPKDDSSGSAIAAGAQLYWDASNEVATTTASTHKKIGPCVKAADADDTEVWAYLQPVI